MDVHRCRFVPYPVAEVNALAFSHQSNPNEPNPSQLRLALGRSNGDIEIWDPLGGAWVQETIIRGGKDRTVEGLAWTQDPEYERADGKLSPGKLRLFSIGYSPVVTEWDLITGRPARQCGGTHGDVWCIAAQPQEADRRKKMKNKLIGEEDSARKNAEQLLALGCADGSVVLLSTADGDLTYLKTLPKSSGKKPRVISLAWNGRDELIAGFSDSMIRVYEIAGRGRQKAAMSLGSGGKGKPSDTLVWNIKVLRDNSLVSADSTGELKIWDLKNHTLVQRIKGHLDADVLSLAVSYDGSTILSGGMDRRTVLYQQSTSEDSKKKGRWAIVTHGRYHQSDVKVMATYESRQINVVISGGADAVPIVNPLSTFGQEHQRGLAAVASSPVVSSAPDARLLVSWWDREVNIWHVSARKGSTDTMEEALEDQKTRRLVTRLAIQGEESILSAVINQKGDAVAVSTIASTKMFYLRPSKTSKMLRVQKVEIPKAVGKSGSKLVQFSPDGKWLVTTLPDNSIQLLRIAREEGAKQPYSFVGSPVTFSRKHGRTKERLIWGTHGDYDHVITRLAWSDDSRILVAGDISGTVDAWILEGNEDPEWTSAPLTNGVHKKKSGSEEVADSSEDDSEDEEHPQVIMGQHWIASKARLPNLTSTPMVISFRPEVKSSAPLVNGNIGVHATRHNPAPHSHDLPKGEDRFLVVTAKHEVLEYHALSGKLTEWSRRNNSSSLPLEFRNVRDRAMGCFWDISQDRQRVFAYGSTWVWMLDLSRDLPLPETDEEDATQSQEIVSAGRGMKRKRDLVEMEKRAMIKESAGAGTKIPEQHRSLGTGARLSVRVGDEDDAESVELAFKPVPAKRSGERRLEDVDPDELPDSGDESDEESNSDVEEGQLALLKQRREEIVDEHATNGTQPAEDSTSSRIMKAPHSWHTYRYRSIIGIVPLGKPNIASAHDTAIERTDRVDGSGVEVAIVERPLWDADLKARWESSQERGER